MADFEARTEQYDAANPYPGASVHDRDGLMTPDEIIEMKKRLLTEGNPLHWLLEGVVVEIVSDMLEDAAQRTREDEAPATPRDTEAIEAAKLASSAASLAANWTINTIKFCQMPEDQWPEDVTAPSSFALWIEAVEKKAQVSQTQGESA